jgi:hypothetical protein
MTRVLAAALLALTLAAPAARASEQPDAALLLDLDLLRETDPRAQREEPVARHVRLLELLERLNPDAAAGRGREAAPAPKGAC